MANFVVLNDVRHPKHPAGGYGLHFQRVMLHFTDGTPSEMGYRFMWKDEQDRMRSRPCRVELDP